MRTGKCPTAELGRRGEILASRMFRRKGFAVLDRNFRCPMGEIDIIVRKRSLIVFCEVKARTDDGFAPPYEAVNRGKMMRLERTADYWLAKTDQDFDQCRFDVVTVLFSGRKPKLEHFEDAFRPAEVY